MKFPALWQRAADAAATAHAGQTTDGVVPYVAHPFRVAMLVRDAFECRDDEVISAALLHDAVEKTSLALDEIHDRFGERVARLVKLVSKNTLAPGETYQGRLATAEWEARLIKLADALDHLDCPAADLPHRIESGHKALRLAFSDEEPIRKGRECLEQALAECVPAVSAGSRTAAPG